MALNWKIYEHYNDKEDNDSKANEIARVYNDLWEQADQYARDNLKGKELEYFYTTTD